MTPEISFIVAILKEGHVREYCIKFTDRNKLSFNEETPMSAEGKDVFSKILPVSGEFEIILARHIDGSMTVEPRSD